MGKNWLQEKNIFFDDPVFFSSSITSVRIVGDCRPFQKHIGKAIFTTFRPLFSHFPACNLHFQTFSGTKSAFYRFLASVFTFSVRSVDKSRLPKPKLTYVTPRDRGTQPTEDGPNQPSLAKRKPRTTAAFDLWP